MKKEIKFENGTLEIGYNDNTQDISVYESGEYTEPIRLTFIPSTEMTEQKCLEYTNENMPKIIKEAKIVITENNEFYKNFEIDFNSEFSGFNLDKGIVLTSQMQLNCKLKEK